MGILKIFDPTRLIFHVAPAKPIYRNTHQANLEWIQTQNMEGKLMPYTAPPTPKCMNGSLAASQVYDTLK